MIITVTLNPALDRTLRFRSVERGRLNRALHVQEDPSGKGINVSLALKALGAESLVVGLVAGRTGQRVVDGVVEKGIPNRWVWVEGGETRVSTKVFEDVDAAMTELNEPGPTVGDREREEMASLLVGIAKPGDVVVFSGSLPPGCPEGYYLEVGRELHRRGARVAVDSSGGALRASLGLPPCILKPNREEMAYLAGTASPPDAGEAVRLARGLWEDLRARGTEALILTLGTQGAAFFTHEGEYRTQAPVETGGTTAGCGDALLAATLLGRSYGQPWEQVVRFATATAAAAAAILGTQFPGRTEVERRLPTVRVERMDGQGAQRAG